MRSRLKAWGVLGLLVLITVVPLLMARYVFQHPGAIHFNKKNNGKILQPHSLAKIHVYTNGKLNPLSAQSGKWSIVYDSAAACCVQDCQSQLHRLHQLRIAIHNGIERTRVVLLQPKQCAMPMLDSSVVVWSLPQSEKTFWQSGVEKNEAQVLILDPNLITVMQYPKNSAPNPIYEDMRVLLHTSQIG